MKIGFVSDTHGSYEDFLRAIDIFDGPDFIVHTGDVLDYGDMSESPLTRYIREMDNIYLVKGNGDYFDSRKLIGKKQEYTSIFKFEKSSETIKILATHSHRDSLNTLFMKAHMNNCDIMAYGHTHVKALERFDDLIVINPGSTIYPRDGIPSCGILDTDKNKISLIDLNTKKIIKSLDFRK